MVTSSSNKPPKIYRLKATRVSERSSSESNSKSTVSSKGSRQAHTTEELFTKVVRRLSKAHNSGVDAYLEARSNSASNRKDGAVVDFHSNVARGMTAAMLAAAPAIIDLTDSANTKQYRSGLRRALAMYSLPGSSPNDDEDDDFDDDDDDDDRFED
jgi:acetoin utilization deacetylase AcuC-like enzyme